MSVLSENKTGIFGAIKEEDKSRNYDNIPPVAENDPNTIYNLLFKDYDEENNKK